jgi:hypothetical protein
MYRFLISPQPLPGRTKGELLRFQPRSVNPGGRVVNYAAFSVTPVGVNGDVPRSFLCGYDTIQLDAALRRGFGISESLKLQFRAEAFNVLNHPQFAAFDPNVTDGPGVFR